MAHVSVSGVVSVSANWVDGQYALAESVATQMTLADGDGSGEGDAVWRSTLTLEPGDTEGVDLTALAVSPFGASGTVYLASIKLLVMRNTSQHTALYVDAAATNAWESFSPGTIGPRSLAMIYEGAGGGRAITAASKVISIVNNDTTTTLSGTGTGTTITGLSSTSGLYVGMLLGGTHPSGTTIASIVSSTSVTTSAAVTTNGAASFDFTPPPASMDVLIVGVLD